MRNIAERTDGIEKLKLATAAVALLIPPVFMMVVSPATQPAPEQEAQLPAAQPIIHHVPSHPSGKPMSHVKQSIAPLPEHGPAAAASGLT